MSECDLWNRCDRCGKFIAYDDFDNGALRVFVEPDSHFGPEIYETLCIKCNEAVQDG